MNIYANGGTATAPTVGGLVGTRTVTFDIPFRPSHTPLCPDNKWSPSGRVACFSGFATPVMFDIADGPALPDSVIWTVAYTTTHYGSPPLGKTAACFPGCGYDSLNVGAESQAPEPLAVSLNVTATNPTDAGFLTVFPCDAREEVSSVNYDAGQTVANAVVTTVSAAGMVCFYSSRTTDLVVDRNGWFAGDQAFHGVGPRRMFDTRVDLSPSSLMSVPKHAVAPGAVLEMQMTDLPGLVPAAGVGAVSLNVTAIGGASAGFIAVYACGTAAEVSSVNYLAGETVANAVLATVSPAGTVCFASHSEADVVVDINGWIAAGRSFSGVGPARLFDTRAGSSAAARRVVPKAPLGASTILEVKVTDLPISTGGSPHPRWADRFARLTPRRRAPPSP